MSCPVSFSAGQPTYLLRFSLYLELRFTYVAGCTAESPLADGMVSSTSISASTLSGFMTTSSHYRTRRALLSVDQQSLSDTPSADRVYLDRENIIRCVIPSSSGLRRDDTDGSSVLVLFVLVHSPLFRDSASGATRNKEQVLAGMVPSVDVHR